MIFHFNLILQGIANDTVVSLGADNQVNLENNKVLGTKTQNSGNRSSRKKERKEFHETH